MLKNGAGFAPVIPSPLDPDSSAILRETRDTADLAARYLRGYGYDCSEDFAGLSEIAIYECQRTGYRFYYPYHLEGKEKLYRSIEDDDWCYEEAKWEHSTIANIIPETASVLDIGCGRGAFLSKLKTPHRTGIELNKSAAAFTRKRGIDVAEELIGEHAEKYPVSYEVVTAFQVLEHVADPMPFLNSCIAALKPGGMLVIAVPNNDTHLRFVQNLMPLNQPPHHVGLWAPDSLSALSELLPINLMAVIEEPLRELGWYQGIMEDRYLNRWQRAIYRRIGGPKIFARLIEENARSISGHTMIGLFTKD
jgi:SAM-dependent methyltransferase